MEQCYHIYPKYSGRGTLANSVDPDQTAPKEQFDLGLHCLPFNLYFLDTLSRSQIGLFKLLDKYDKKLMYLNVLGKYGKLSWCIA